MATFTVGRHLGKVIQRVRKINVSAKSLVERLCDLKTPALSVFGYVGPISALENAILKTEAHALQCTAAGPYNAVPTSLLCVGSVCGLGPDLVGIHSVSLAAHYRTAACSSALSQGLEKIQAARGCDFAPVLALCSIWGKGISRLRPWLVAQRKRSILYVVWTAMANLMILHRTRNRRLPQPCFKTNYIGRILLNRSPHGPQMVLGPISRLRVVEILPHMKLVSRASRPGLTVGFLRILCNALCTAQRFPRRSHLLHDLITQVFLRSLLYGIVVMGFIDAFVYAHHQHRRSIENPGDIGDYMKGRIRFHDGYHSCLRSRIPGNLPNKTHACSPASELPLAEAQSQISASLQHSYHNTRKRQ